VSFDSFDSFDEDVLDGDNSPWMDGFSHEKTSEKMVEYAGSPIRLVKSHGCWLPCGNATWLRNQL